MQQLNTCLCTLLLISFSACKKDVTTPSTPSTPSTPLPLPRPTASTVYAERILMTPKKYPASDTAGNYIATFTFISNYHYAYYYDDSVGTVNMRYAASTNFLDARRIQSNYPALITYLMPFHTYSAPPMTLFQVNRNGTTMNYVANNDVEIWLRYDVSDTDTLTGQQVTNIFNYLIKKTANQKYKIVQ